MKNKQSQLLLAVLLGISVQALNVNHVQAAENDASIKILLDRLIIGTINIKII